MGNAQTEAKKRQRSRTLARQFAFTRLYKALNEDLSFLDLGEALICYAKRDLLRRALRIRSKDDFAYSKPYGILP